MHCLVDGWGRPLVIAVTPGQSADSPALLPMLGELRVPRVGPGRPRTRRRRCGRTRRTRPGCTGRICALAASPRSFPNPPTRPATAGAADRRATARSASTSRTTSTATVVERAFNTVKNWRALATRYDKYALVYRGGLVLAAILAWLK